MLQGHLREGMRFTGRMFGGMSATPQEKIQKASLRSYRVFPWRV